MPGARLRHRLPWAAAVALLGAVSGCGGDAESPVAAPVPMTAPAPEPFPPTDGSGLGTIEARVPEGPVLEPRTGTMTEGRNRVAFALTDAAGQHLAGADVGLYLARPDGGGLRGPLDVRSETLGPAPISTESRPRTLYVSDVRFPRPGEWRLLAVVRLDGRLVRSAPTPVRVASSDGE